MVEKTRLGWRSRNILLEGLKAKQKRRAKSKTGTNRSINGGGGSGGRKSGNTARTAVITTITIIADLLLQ